MHRIIQRWVLDIDLDIQPGDEPGKNISNWSCSGQGYSADFDRTDNAGKSCGMTVMQFFR